MLTCEQKNVRASKNERNFPAKRKKSGLTTHVARVWRVLASHGTDMSATATAFGSASASTVAAATTRSLRRSSTAAGWGERGCRLPGDRGIIGLTKKRTSTAYRAVDEQTVVSPSPRDPTCASDWWKDAVIYQVKATDPVVSITTTDTDTMKRHCRWMPFTSLDKGALSVMSNAFSNPVLAI